MSRRSRHVAHTQKKEKTLSKGKKNCDKERRREIFDLNIETHFCLHFVRSEVYTQTVNCDEQRITTENLIFKKKSTPSLKKKKKRKRFSFE